MQSHLRHIELWSGLSWAILSGAKTQATKTIVAEHKAQQSRNSAHSNSIVRPETTNRHDGTYIISPFWEIPAGTKLGPPANSPKLMRKSPNLVKKHLTWQENDQTRWEKSPNWVWRSANRAAVLPTPYRTRLLRHARLRLQPLLAVAPGAADFRAGLSLLILDFS